MDKKIIGIIILVIVICAVIAAMFILNKNNDKTTNENTTSENTENESNDNIKVGDGKTLVVYYSAQSHTKDVALKIADNLGADTFEIVPKDKYNEADLDWTDDNSRVSKEHDDESLRNVKLTNTKVDNWDNYDTILIGYPIWWGVAAWPVNTFVKDNNFDGKTVIPFCTSASSGLGESGDLLAKEAGTGNWLEGHRFSSNASESDIKSFTDSLK